MYIKLFVQVTKRSDCFRCPYLAATFGVLSGPLTWLMLIA